MAQSRLERLGTIYTRTQTLIKGNALKQEDLPLWFKIYEAFPPKYEPTFDRAVPAAPIKQIFYKEDVVRAKFQKEHTNLPIINLNNPKSQTPTQKFLSIYNGLKKAGTNEEILYQQAVEEYKSQVKQHQPAKTEPEKPQATAILHKQTNIKQESRMENEKDVGNPSISLQKIFDN